MNSHEKLESIAEPLLRVRAPEAEYGQFREALRRTRETPASNRFFADYAAAGRWLGNSPLRPEAREKQRLGELDAEVAWETWTPGDLGRAWLLDTLIHAGRDPVSDLLPLADRFEHAAVLRALPLLPAPSSRLTHALEGCRSNVPEVFHAIARGNPYPARHFDDAAFNQMTLKALFTESPARDIVGLERRANADLRRMAADYRDERLSAGRKVSDDHVWVLSLFE